MRYTQSHEWIAVEGLVGTVGITEYAQKELGDIVYIELPKIGRLVKAGEEVCVLESTKAAVDVYSPVSGKIIEVNEALVKSPMNLKGSLPSVGWLFKLEVLKIAEIEHLFTHSQYQALHQS